MSKINTRDKFKSKLKKITSKLGFGETASIKINLDDYKTLVDNNSEQIVNINLKTKS